MRRSASISMKWKMTIGVFLIMTPVGVAIWASQQVLIKGIDSTLFEALESRANANVVTTSTDISFELAAGLREEIEGKLKKFVNKHSETFAMVVLDAKKGLFAQAGNKVNLNELIASIPSLAKTNALVVDARVIATAPIVTEGQSQPLGYLIYVESLDSYFLIRSRMLSIGLMTFMIGLIFILIGAYFLGYRSAVPIYELASAAERIADGDLESVDIQLGRTGFMEAEKLAFSIQRMATALQRQVSGIKNLTSRMSDMSKEVTVAVTNLASSASQQASAVTETASTVEEIEQTSKVAAGNAGRIVEAAVKTQEASMRGHQAVKTTNEIIIKIKDDSQAISEKSAKLLLEVEEVESVIESVRGIAEQSKILAVNASIEAAKAGEYGSGFAVVAQEVKDLAQQSKDATVKITGTLNAIRQAIDDMVDTANSGKERTEEGVSTISNAGAIMYDLSEAIRENSEFANVIASNIKQQTVGLSQISIAMDEINTTASDNQNISRTIEQRAGQMNGEVGMLLKMVDQWRTPELTVSDRPESGESAD